MSEPIKTPFIENNAENQGSILGGVLGAAAGTVICTLALLLCGLFRISAGILILLLFAGLVIGQFYQLFHGRRSKAAAYGTVGVCTILTCVLWVFALLFVIGFPSRPAAEAFAQIWSGLRKQLLLYVGIGLAGFFLTRKSLLTYADREKGPWHMAYSYSGGALYNLLPERLPAKAPPAVFAVRDRFTPKTRIIVEGSALRWTRLFRKDRVFTAQDIAGVVLGPSGGCNVIYDKDYRLLAKFAASMEYADLLLLWLLQRDIPIDKMPEGWRLPEMAEPAEAENPNPQRQFTLTLKPSARRGFIGIGVFLLLLGLILPLAFLISSMTMVERLVIGGLNVAVIVEGIVFLRIGKVCRVEIDGEQVCAVSRFGRTRRFSVRDVASVSRSIGWIILYDKEWKPLAKVDPGMDNLNMLEDYLAFYGVSV